MAFWRSHAENSSRSWQDNLALPQVCMAPDFKAKASLSMGLFRDPVLSSYTVAAPRLTCSQQCSHSCLARWAGQSCLIVDNELPESLCRLLLEWSLQMRTEVLHFLGKRCQVLRCVCCPSTSPAEAPGRLLAQQPAPQPQATEVCCPCTCRSDSAWSDATSRFAIDASWFFLIFFALPMIETSGLKCNAWPCAMANKDEIGITAWISCLLCTGVADAPWPIRPWPERESSGNGWVQPHYIST